MMNELALVRAFYANANPPEGAQHYYSTVSQFAGAPNT
jgi:hypothetical protein